MVTASLARVGLALVSIWMTKPAVADDCDTAVRASQELIALKETISKAIDRQDWEFTCRNLPIAQAKALETVRLLDAEQDACGYATMRFAIGTSLVLDDEVIRRHCSPQ